MIDGCLDYLQNLIALVDSLRRIGLEPDFKGSDWVSKK